LIIVNSRSGIIISILAWVAALVLAGFALFLGWNTFSGRAASQPEGDAPVKKEPELEEQSILSAPLPDYRPPGMARSISRRAVLHTFIPNRPRLEVKVYTVAKGDSLFGIANFYNLRPETVLWANFDLLNDNPDTLSIGMELKIPPVDGVFYEWREGDTLEGVAARFQAELEHILGWPGNDLDLTSPTIAAGTQVMIPGGRREYRSWVIPDIPRGRAGVSKSLYGAGACEGAYDGAFGTGGFIWPAGNHRLSGNDYWEGHLGIDVGAGEGAQIYAADSGVVVFAGWALGGYGNMVMLDHGNGYQTLYAHMSNVSVSCGSSVSQGGVIGSSGSTGNSTGAHLHFEVRYMGGFLNPWHVLPPP
jgi:murein DD-endopeptidase MepM/ murein hydrolase activator NlpD